ncbi:predicted protein [Histoplasma mississippiense (nom. inval.)]|uniref:predicted protein n=1 Tax=Ajellomyces capsulatus (strain NAm1 / WU24) TaxID=2059318 RepID=UPI000157D4F9|nr:predicted protein [Histoplasma mississippiense (nom. inval.)]EDN05108.1 predicted protein [Histoplasma mississippiense (nom. inval.)]
MFGCISALNVAKVLFRNLLARHPPFPIAEVAPRTDAVELTFCPSRPWKPRPGQHIYLYVPAVRCWPAQRFELAWWETSPDGRAASVSVLIEVDSGFTRKLWLTRHRRLRIIVDGPYGGKDLDRWQPLSTGFPYDAVALVATGIGIVGQLPFIRELLQRFVSEEKAMHTRGGGVRRHRISLVWQLDKEEHMNWICDWMDQLLADDDTTLILHISLYILDCSDQSVRNERPGRRIDVHYKEELDVKKILDRELEEWSDKMLVTARFSTKFSQRRILGTECQGQARGRVTECTPGVVLQYQKGATTFVNRDHAMEIGLASEGNIKPNIMARMLAFVFLLSLYLLHPAALDIDYLSSSAPGRASGESR